MKLVQPRTGFGNKCSSLMAKVDYSLWFLGAAEFIYHSNIHGIIPVLLALCCFMLIKDPIQKKPLDSVYHLGKHELSE